MRQSFSACSYTALILMTVSAAFGQLSPQWTQEQVYNGEQLAHFISDDSQNFNTARLYDLSDRSILSYGWQNNKSFFQANGQSPTLIFSPQRASSLGLTYSQWGNERFSADAVVISGKDAFDISNASVYLFDSQSVQSVWSNPTPTLAGYQYIDFDLDNRDVGLLLRSDGNPLEPQHSIARWSNGYLNLVTPQPLRDPISNQILSSITQFQFHNDSYSFIGSFGEPFDYEQTALYRYHDGVLTRVFTEHNAREQGVTFDNMGMWNFYTALGDDGNLLLAQISSEYPDAFYSVFDGQMQTLARIGQTVSTPFWGDVTLDNLFYGLRDGRRLLFYGAFLDPNTSVPITALFLSENGTLSYVRTLSHATEYSQVHSFSGNSFTMGIDLFGANFSLYRYSQATVPEPGTLALLAVLGLSGFCLRRRRVL